MNSQTSNPITTPYSPLNRFNEELKEVFEIIKDGNPRILKQLLGFQPHISLEGHYYQKYTPLMEAVYLNKLDMIVFICSQIKNKYTRNDRISIHYKQYINQISSEGKSALMIGVLSNQSTDIIQYLIKEGANLYIKDNQGKDIFYYSDYSLTDEIETFVKSLR